MSDVNTHWSGFIVDDPNAGFVPTRTYPGTISTDGAFVVVANDHGRLYRYPLGSVRFDVESWRVRTGITSRAVDDVGETFKRISDRVRAIHATTDRIRRPEVGDKQNYASVRENVRASLRMIARIVDPALERELWEAVDQKARPTQ